MVMYIKKVYVVNQEALGITNYPIFVSLISVFDTSRATSVYARNELRVRETKQLKKLQYWY
jgi:hypothetical protein